MSRPIPTIDLLFLLAESRDTPQHVAGVMLFENPTPASGWRIGDLVQQYRAARPIFPFNVTPRFSLTGLPRWIEAADIDMSYHVQHVALPAPGSERQLNDLVERWHSVLFDRGQPLFQMCVIEGLENDRFAIYVKIHHAIVDGASAIARILAGVSPEPTAPVGLPFFAVDMGAAAARGDAPKGLVAKLGDTSGELMNRYKVAMDLSAGFWKKMLARAGGAPAIGSRPFEAPMTLFNAPILHGRSYARVTLPMDPMRAIGKAAGGTLNDIVMTLVDTAVHAYLRERNSPLGKRLLALVPVSLREAGDVEATTKVSALVISLGDAEIAIGTRLEQIKQHMQEAKAEVKAMSKAAAGGYSVALYAAAQALGKLGITRPLANMIISNVPGAARQTYLGGSPMLAIYPVSVISVGMGLNITLISNAGHLHVGITSQSKSVPDPQRLADLMAAGLEELMKAGSPAPARPARPPRPAKPAEPARAGAKSSVRSRAKPVQAKSRVRVERQRPAREVAGV